MGKKKNLFFNRWHPKWNFRFLFSRLALPRKKLFNVNLVAFESGYSAKPTLFSVVAKVASEQQQSSRIEFWSVSLAL